MKNVTLGFLAVAIFSASAVNAQDSGDAKKGKDIFLAYTCYGCHGFSGQNGPGMRLAPMKLPAATFINMVRTPSQPNRMPPYSAKVITDAQLTDVWAYLKTLPDSPAAKDIPLLQQLKNQ
jgi:ubiquinol-cytochrome c reductase cytochrome c subunit